MGGADTLEVELQHRFPGGGTLDVQFAVPWPGVVGLWGVSGAGKSSVAAAVAGTFRPDRCRIAVGGTVLADETRWVPPDRRRVGMVFQDGRLFPHLSVRKNLRFGLTRAGPAAEAASGPDFDGVVSLLGLRDLLQRRVRGLSGGEAQRVAIGRAILSRPLLLVLDEPLAALDAERRRDILRFLRDLRGAGVPMLFITHSRAEAAALCDHIVVLGRGRVLAQGAAGAVLSGPAMAGRPGAAALLDGRELDRRDGVMRVAAGGWELVAAVPPGQAVGGDAAVRLAVPAEAVVILAGALPAELAASARNLLPARVLSVDGAAPQAVTIRLGPDGVGDGVLLARVTAESVARLALVPGRSVWAMVKAEAITVAGEGNGDDG